MSHLQPEFRTGSVEMHPDLMESVVTRILRSELASPYWTGRESLYQDQDMDNRFARLDQLNQEMFREMGFADLINQIWSEMLVTVHPRPRCCVTTARMTKEEGAELFVRDEEKTVILRVCSDRFEQTSSLQLFLRREFLHIADMLDPEFGYSPDLVLPADIAWQKTVITGRYRALWNIAVDARLVRRNLASPDVKQSRWLDFLKTFDVLGEDCHTVYEWLFEIAVPNHALLSVFALSPREAWRQQEPVECPR